MKVVYCLQFRPHDTPVCKDGTTIGPIPLYSIHATKESAKEAAAKEPKRDDGEFVVERWGVHGSDTVVQL
jgi:hypothetical protein